MRRREQRSIPDEYDFSVLLGIALGLSLTILIYYFQDYGLDRGIELFLRRIQP